MITMKAALHLHINGDPVDNIKYSAFEAIDKAAELNFDVISFTCHKTVIFDQEMSDYAKSKNIILIPGIEAKIEKKDIILINVDKSAEKIKTFAELKKFREKNPECLIIAAHPYFILPSCIGSKLETHIDLFDAIEWNFFYSKSLNPNKKAAKIAKLHNKPLIGTSDIHILKYFDTTYCEVKAKNKSISEFINAIKSNQVDLHTKSFSNIQLFRLLYETYKAIK